MITTEGHSFWNGKRVFITQPTSFLGVWTTLMLQHLGAQVFGFSEYLQVTPNLFDLAGLAQSIAMTYGDIRDQESLRQALDFAQADIVIHLGESGSLTSADQRPLEVISKSVMGTATLLELLKETASVRSVVVVSSDKVYAKSTQPLTETDLITASTILPTAKLCSELLALSYRNTFFNPDKYNKHKIAIATARVGSALGGGDFSPQALIPEAVQSFLNKKPFEIKNPQSVRPWIHVLDQAHGILILAQKLYEKGPKLSPTYNLGASEYESVGMVMKTFSEVWGTTWSSVNIAETSKAPSFHGKLAIQKAEADLGWRPRWDLKRSLEETAQWYQAYFSGKSAPDQLTQTLRSYFNK